MIETVNLPESRVMNAEEKAVAAEASSANSRINIPLNVSRWKILSQELQDDLIWFHQYCLDEGLTMDDAAKALSYDRSTIHKILWGVYTGSWENACQRVRSFKRLLTERSTIQANEFVENSMTRLMFAGLNYALANNSITLIVGESRMGKTVTARAWRDLNNHGRSAFVTAPAYGGTKALLRDIARCLGGNKNHNSMQMHEGILRAFNKNRILIVDEAHRLLPNDRRTNPVNLEILRDIHDRTGCALALLATQRFDADLRKSEYMFEQLLGRIGMPVRLPRKIKASDFEPILRQYVVRPGVKLIAACEEIANTQGRLGILVETLKVASRMAAKEQKSTTPKMTDEHVFKAIALRKQMMGELIYAEK